LSGPIVPSLGMAVPPIRTASARCLLPSRSSGEQRNSTAPPRYAGERLSRKVAESSVSAYSLPCLLSIPIIVRKSHRMRMPRSEASQRFAIVAAVVLPSPMAVNTSSSMAAFKASVRWCALIIWKNNCGDGCCWAVEELDIKIPFCVGIYLYRYAADTIELVHAKPSQPLPRPCLRLADDCGASPRSVTAPRPCAKTCETDRPLRREFV